MSAVISAPFGVASAVLVAKAGNAAYRRALQLGYSRTAAQHFAHDAKRECSEWEDPAQTALRVVHPPRGTFAGNGGAA